MTKEEEYRKTQIKSAAVGYIHECAANDKRTTVSEDFTEGAKWADSTPQYWETVSKDNLPPYNVPVLVVLPFPDVRGKCYIITDAIRPSPDKRDPQAYYDKYGFEELTDTPLLWRTIPCLKQIEQAFIHIKHESIFS